MNAEIPEIRLALFGPSASGKTTFLASYFGNQQRFSFEKEHGYRLDAVDVSDGNQLLARYYRMEKGSFPLGTERFSEFKFDLRVGDLPHAGLRVVWYDYPGGWWENSPKDESEKSARERAIGQLLNCHVGILLIDGMKYSEEGTAYVKHTLDQFKNEARQIARLFASQGNPVDLPKEWIIAISKADLLPQGKTAEMICKEIVSEATDQLQGVANAVSSKSFGSQYLMLSSVRGEGSSVLDDREFIGLQLVAPIALVTVLSVAAETASKGSPATGLLKTIFERVSAIVDVFDKLDDFLPQKYQVLTNLLKAFALKDGLEKGAAHFREKTTGSCQTRAST